MGSLICKIVTFSPDEMSEFNASIARAGLLKSVPKIKGIIPQVSTCAVRNHTCFKKRLVPELTSVEFESVPDAERPPYSVAR